MDIPRVALILEREKRKNSRARNNFEPKRAQNRIHARAYHAYPFHA